MNKEERIWMAGFIDGEGCITVHRATGRRLVNPNYGLMVLVSNTNRSLLEHCQSLNGGSITEKKIDAPHKTCWQWVLCSDNAVNFLKQILPYLRGKEEHALLGIKLQGNINKGIKKNRRRGARLTPQESMFRKQIYDKIRQLNTRGLPTEP